MLMNDNYGQTPGLSTARETYENEFRWGSQYQGIFANGVISGAARDSGNSPTYELRPGLLLGQITASGLYTNYSPTATDGSEVAVGILLEGLRVQDFEGNNQNKLYGILVGGPVQTSKVLNLDNMAKQQMSNFIFDDIGGIPGNHWYQWRRFQTKTSSYTLVAADNFTHFDNLGAAGAVVFTLPAIANGYQFGFRVMTGQNVTIQSAEGTNIVALNNASASSVAFSTGGQLIGGGVAVYSNPAGTKWLVQNMSAGANTVTVA